MGFIKSHKHGGTESNNENAMRQKGSVRYTINSRLFQSLESKLDNPIESEPALLAGFMPRRSQGSDEFSGQTTTLYNGHKSEGLQFNAFVPLFSGQIKFSNSTFSSEKNSINGRDENSYYLIY